MTDTDDSSGYWTKTGFEVVIFMKNLGNLIVTGLAIAGAAVVTYRTYEIKKLRKAEQDANIIEIEVESSDKKTAK